MADLAMSGPRVLFYVQHLLGIGHVARASRVAGALAEDGFAVTVVTGGTPVPGFPGAGVESVTLPTDRRCRSGIFRIDRRVGQADRRRLQGAPPRHAARDARQSQAGYRGDRGLSVRPAADALRAAAAARRDRCDDTQAGAGRLGARHLAGAGQGRPQRRDGRDRQPPFRPGDGPWRPGLRDARRQLSARRIDHRGDRLYRPGGCATPDAIAGAIRGTCFGGRRRGRQAAGRRRPSRPRRGCRRPSAGA